jgi:glutamate dehydrogenase
MGIDAQKDHIRVVGIGDMSGDVFGNGMLLSSSIKLVAAFNHLHIFIDPNPDPVISFKERQRLFDLPLSQWKDYNPSIISSGGGVFERSAKTITLSKEMQELLGTNELELETDQLIALILKSEVDLIWNGGIGTYIKSTEEDNLEIGDKANDNLRCNGSDIKAKVIGEGGNLGVSQLGRIEFAKRGGYINTDFIDNSAGVDCSDHEVNIKIALNRAMITGKLDINSRNALLASMQDEVAELVLQDNFQQNQTLTISERSEAFTIESYSHLIDTLEQGGFLDRRVEFIPSQQELSRRAASKEKMTRPELSVLLSYSKMFVHDQLVDSSIYHDEHFEKDLLEYFPKKMRDDFSKEILSHPLRKEIILTVITNKIVNHLNGVTISDIQKETGAKLCDIVRSYVIISEIFDIDSIWKMTENLDTRIAIDVKVSIFADLIKVMRRGISWFLKNLEHPISITEAVSYYSEPTKKLSNILSNFVVGDAKDKFDKRRQYYLENGISESFASKIAIMECFISVFDILAISKNTDIDKESIASIYFQISERFSVDWLRKCAEKHANNSYWNKLAIQAIKDDLYDKQRRLLEKIVVSKLDVGSWYEQNTSQLSDFMNFLDEIKKQDSVDLNMILLANKKFEIFLRKT